MFDNSKIKRLVPEFHPRDPVLAGRTRIVAYHHEIRISCASIPVVDALMDRPVEHYG